MKPIFIIILFKTPKSEILRLKKEIGLLRLSVYFIDNTKTKKGYAYGINQGLKKAIANGYDLFIIANPDISLKNISFPEVLKTGKYFDLWGLAMKQSCCLFYGGKIDKWRMSAKLNPIKPAQRFASCDYVTGSLMLIKKKVVDKIGYFEEEYGMYYEDADYCFRAEMAGLKIGINTKYHYDHFENSKYTKNKDQYLFKNRLRFFLRYSSLAQKVYELIRLPLTVFEYLTLNKTLMLL